MKKISKTIDPIFGIPLSEDHAFPRGKAIKTLDALQDQITDHLVLLFSAKPKSRDISGWETELNAWRSQLVRRNRGKAGKKNFSEQDLVTALWVEPFESQADRDFIVNQINQSKGMSIGKISEQDFKKFVARFIASILNNTPFKK